MTETREIKCDGCDKDLTYTGNCEDYYLVVGSASKRKWYEKDGERGGFVTAMAISPPVSRAHHFCGFKCMDKWRDAQRNQEARHKQWYEDHKVKADGISFGDGRVVYRYPDGPWPTGDELAALYPSVTFAPTK